MARDLDQLFNLSGKVAVIIGAASGIGKASAGLIAEAGATVIVADQDEAGADAVAASLVGNGGQASSVAVDVSHEQSVRDLFASLDEVDIVVNCVGIYPKTALLDTTVEEWDAVHGVNLKGAFLCVREAGKSMVAGGRGGSIVSVSSISSLHPAVIGNAASGRRRAD